MPNTPLIACHSDDSIASVLGRCRDLLVSLRWALVTSLDSATDLHSVSEKGVFCSEYKASFLGGSILLSGRELVRAAEELRLFNGFDEVWWFNQPPEKAKPGNVWITAPVDLSKGIPKDVSDWVMSSHCILGLGDGIGLNCITDRRDLFRAINQ